MESDNILLRVARSIRLVPPVAEAGFRPSLRLLAVSSVAINLFALTIPIVMLITMDRILPFRAMDTLVLLMIGAALALFVENLLRMMRSQLTAWSAASFEHSTSVDVTSRLLAQPLLGFEGAGSGRHLDQFRKIAMLRQYFSGQSFTGWIDLPFSAFYVLVVALLSWKLALVMAVGFGVFTWYARRMAVSQHLPAADRMMADQRRNNFLIEILGNIHTLKSMAMEALMLRRYDRLQESSALAVERQARALDESTSLAGLFGPLIGTLVTAIGAWEVIAGDLSRGELSACIFLSLRSLSPLQRVGLLWAKHHSDAVIGEEVGELLDAPALPAENGAARALSHDAPAIELAGLTFGDSSDGKGLIANVNLTVRTGETVLLRGENGSGRSTLLGLIAGFFTPGSGNVRLFGEDVSHIDRSRLTERVGYLPQRAIMFDGTLLQNATLFRPELTDRARAIAAELGFSDFILALPQGWETRVGDSAAERLPPGLRQRIGMIRALVTDPQIILFDDATAAVDSEGESAVIRFLEQVKRDKAIVIVSHRPSLMRLADREYVLEGSVEGSTAPAPAALPSAAAGSSALAQIAPSSLLEAAPANRFDSAFWEQLDRAVADAFRQQNELSRIVAPLLREIGWRGAARDVIEALPYYADELDVTGLTNALARLGFKVTERSGVIESIDDRGFPCLVLAEDREAVLLLEKRLDGYVVSNSLDETLLDTAPFGAGRAIFFEREPESVATAKNWTRGTISRLRPIVLQAVVLSTLIGVLLLGNALFTTLVFSEVLPSGARDTLAYALLGVIVSFGLVHILQGYRARLLAFIAGRVEFLFGTAALGKLMQLGTIEAQWLQDEAVKAFPDGRTVEVNPPRQFGTSPMNASRDTVFVTARPTQAFPGWKVVLISHARNAIIAEREAQLRIMLALAGLIVALTIIASGLADRSRRMLDRMAQSLTDLALLGGEPEQMRRAFITELGDISSRIAQAGSSMQKQRLALLTNRRRLQVIIEHGGLVIYTIDTTRPKSPNLTFITPSIDALLGYQQEEVFTHDWLPAHLHPDDMLEPPVFSRAFKPGAVITREYRLRHKLGHYVWVHDCLVIDDHGDGLPGEAVGFIIDISDRKAATEKLTQAGKMESLGRMAAGVAHELNQPLNFISLASQNLYKRFARGDVDPAYATDKIERILSQVKRAAMIVGQVRTFGRSVTETSPVIAVGDVVADVASLLKGQLDLKGVTLKCLPTDPALQVRVHPVRLGQVLINLVINARDSILQRREDGRPTPGTITMSAHHDDGWVEIAVEDTGTGIAPDKLAMLFEPFFTTKSPQEGTGLGLSVSYGIIAEVGGSIRAENTADGARFIVRLPVPNLTLPNMNEAE